MNDKELNEFLKKYAQNKHTEGEHSLFITWISHARLEQIQQVMDQYSELSDIYGEYNRHLFSALERDIENRLDEITPKEDEEEAETQPRRFLRFLRGIAAAAAIVLLFLTVGIYFREAEPETKGKEKTGKIAGAPKKEKPYVSVYRNDVAPGSNRAVLSLSNGTTILLDAAGKGVLVRQGNIVINKTADGQLVCKVLPTDSVGNAPVSLFTTISTPRGGQFQIMLPDGTKVWLNAASSLKFPFRFTADERKVELSGEAYFEVAKNRDLPFRVQSARQTVEVLGTHFNIKAYPDEPAIKTTLLEGSVKVIQENSRNSVMLSPGQQSNVNEEMSVSKVDTEFAIAWKNGLTSFKNADIKSILKQVERWYDVKAVYEGEISQRTFSGDIPRSSNLSELLQVLETSNIHFKIDGKVITVTP